MNWQFTIYWKDLLREVITIAQELLADQKFPVQYNRYMRSILKGSQQFLQLLETVAASSENVVDFAHEIQTPCSSIIGYSGLILSDDSELDKLSAPQREKVQRIADIGQQFITLINNTLDYHKLLLGKVKFEPSDVEASTPIESIRDWFPRSLSITYVSNPTLCVDRTQMPMLCLHLIAAVRRSAPNLSLDIKIEKDGIRNQGKLIFLFKDVPLTKADLDTMLNQESALKSNMLDLVIANLLIERQNGKFEYQLDGQQLTFTVWLPLANDKS